MKPSHPVQGQCKSEHGLIWLLWGRRWVSWWVVEGSPPVVGAGVCMAGGCCRHSQPHGVQPPFPWDTCGYGPDGLVPKALCEEISSTREELPSAETWHLFGAVGSSLASAPCGKGSRERREEQCCCQGGRRGGLFITRLHLHRGNSYECHWHICSEREK